MNKSLKTIGKIAFVILKNLARLALLLLFGLVRLLGWLSRHLDRAIYAGCISLGIFKEQTAGPIEFTQKFTEKEIEAMASAPKVADMTLEEIQDHFGVSYRQARKIKKAATGSLPVFHYRAGQQAV